MATTELKVRLKIGNPQGGREQPHVAFANLPDDPESLLEFTRHWGKVMPGVPRENIKGLPHFRDSLRAAWSGDETALAGFSDYSGRMFVSKGKIEFEAKDLWSAILLLFFRDRAARKTAICANPKCMNPYFIRKRKTQKYCEGGPCKEEALRKQKLEWWNRNHAPRRKK